MKVLELVAEQFKRLKVVRIKPNGTLAVVSGRNAQGKSSVIDALQAALGGKSSIPERPVRDGEEMALVVVDLGDIVVHRKIVIEDGEVLEEEW